MESSYYIVIDELLEEDGYFYAPVYFDLQELLKEHPGAKYYEYRYFIPSLN